MKLYNITNLRRIKVYYPFLKYKTNYTTLKNKNHKIYMLYLFLFADVLIFPPSHLIDDIEKNMEQLGNDKFFINLIINGRLITTTIYEDVLNFKELIEKELYLKKINKPNLIIPNINMYFRDEKLQRKVYSNYLQDKLEELNLSKNLRSSITEELGKNPRHELFLSFLKKKVKEKFFMETLLEYTQIAYHLGGVKGNDAIVPVLEKKHIYEPAYNPMYYIGIIEKVGEFFYKNTKPKYTISSLLENPQNLEDVFAYTSTFKKLYKDLAEEIVSFKNNLYSSIETFLIEMLSDDYDINLKRKFRKFYKKMISFLIKRIFFMFLEKLELIKSKQWVSLVEGLIKTIPHVDKIVIKLKRILNKFLKTFAPAFYIKSKIENLLDRLNEGLNYIKSDIK